MVAPNAAGVGSDVDASWSLVDVFFNPGSPQVEVFHAGVRFKLGFSKQYSQ